MSDPGDSDPPLAGENPHQTAHRIADQLAPMIRLAGASGSDFLAYLLGMALKEAWLLSQE